MDEGELATVSGVLFEEALDGTKTLRNAFGVIDAIDADAQKRSTHIELFEQVYTFEVRQFERRPRLRVSRDADGERTDQCGVPAAIDGEVLALNAGFERAVNGI